MKKIIIALSIAALALVSCCNSEPGVVKVTGGTIKGVVEEGMTIYKGIPFAAPPVGDLRWKAPQPVIPWEGVRDATEFGHSPIQTMNINNSEDCLYLNVWTPAESKKDKLPVMVWIYGGGFSMGTTSFYDGTALAEKGVVLVTVNYRVGQIGYFCHPELSAENEHGVSGNYGILDQIAGLQWVQDNIAAFGGDPDNVTIFGESAGGISVSMLCASPLAKGLFHRAISQSGGSFGPIRKNSYPGENMKALAVAEQNGVALAESLGAASLAELRALDASEFAKPTATTGGPWPVVDGYVIPDDQHVMYSEGNFNDVDILVGYNSDEGQSFAPSNDVKSFLEQTWARYEKFTPELLAVYPITDKVVLKSGRDLTRDAAFGWQTWVWAKLQSEKGKANVYLYYFDQHPEYPEGDPRYGYESPHGQDVNYVFGSLRGDVSESDARLSAMMMDYWTNFARTGDPNGEGLAEWTRFTPDNHASMLLNGDTPGMIAVPDESAMEVLDAYFAWRREDYRK